MIICVHSRVSAYFVQPKETAIPNVITSPFSSKIWLTMGSTWILMILATSTIATIRRQLSMEVFEDEEMSQKSVMWALATACQQGRLVYNNIMEAH